MKPVILTLLTCLISINMAIASKILFLMPISSKSHKNVFDPLIEALAERNHEITVISPFKTGKNPLVRDIVPSTFEFIMQEAVDPFDTRRNGKLSLLSGINRTHLGIVCHRMYQNEEVKDLMSAKFDLIIANGLVNHCVNGLLSHFNCPHILLTTLPAPNAVTQKVGNYLPRSFVPVPFFDYTDRMTFLQRTGNTLFDVIVNLAVTYIFEPHMEEIYKEYVPNVKSVSEIHKGTSMIFMNSHFSFTYPRPLLPNIVEVGGMHCKPVSNPLPKDIDDFITGAEHGFILFSLGSIVKAKNMPDETRKVFVNVFSRLKQRVIWKWETEEMADLPKNVKLSKWLPQQDILAHKNIRLFMTHGGLLSTQEAIYHGVPLLGTPIFADQDLNMNQAEKIGFCLTIEILDLTEERLESALHKILNEPQFTERAKALSKVYRDQPQTSLERAVFWSEYVLRHKGAPHLQSPARDLNFLQYHSIDVIAFLSSILLVTLWLLKFLIWNILICKLLCRLFRSNTGSSSNKNKASTNKNSVNSALAKKNK